MSDGLRTSPTTARTAAPWRAGHLLQVGLGGEGVVQGRIVGAAVHRHHLPSGRHEQIDRRRADAPRRAGDDRGRAHERRPVRRHGRGQVAHERVEQRPALLGARTRRDRPARRWTIPAAPLRRADGAAAWRAARCSRARPVRGARPQGRWPAASDVSVRPACASPPGVAGPPDEHVVALGGAAPLRRDQRLLVAAVRVDEHHAGEGAAGGAHQLDEQVRQDLVADEERAGEAGVLAAGPVGHGGRHGDARAARRQPGGHGDGDAGVGVEGEVRPVLLERAQRDRQQRARPGRLHLGPGGAGELHGLRCGPASGSGRAWAPGRASRPASPWSGRAPTAAARSSAASAASPCPCTHSGSGPSRGRPVKNLAAMQPPRQASKEPHDAQAPALCGSRSEVNSAESRQTAGKPPASRTLPARNWRSMTKGQA